MSAEKVNCWEHLRCGREPGGERCDERGPCPAAVDATCDGINGGTNGGRICWAVPRTFCHDEVQGEPREKVETCRECSFYRRVKYEEGPHFQRLKLGLGREDPQALHRLLNSSQELLAVCRDIFAHLAVGPLLRRITSHAREITGAFSAAAYLLSDDRRALVLKAHSGSLGRPERIERDSSCASAAAFREGGLQKETTPSPTEDGREALVAAISIGGEDGRTGALEIVVPQAELSLDDEFFLWEFALMAGLGVANSRLVDSLHDLREYDRAKSRFVALLMHHISSPLATVATSLQAIRQLGDALDDADREQMIRYSMDHISSVQALSKRLLDLERIRSGRSLGEAQAVDLLELLHDEVQAHAADARERGVQVAVSCEGRPPTVLADGSGLRLIFGNLLDNAIKYSVLPQMRVEVEVESASEVARVRVRDHGIGIPREEQAGIFEEFHRAGNVAESGSSGFGLGLAFVKELVDRYEGSLELESAAGEGTTVTVELPLA